LYGAAAWVAAFAWGCASPAAAAGLDADAESLARGGVAALDGLETSPGARVEPGVAVGFTLERPYLGTDLAGAVVRLRCARGRWALAAALAQQRSPVHRDTQFGVAIQGRSGAVRWGAGAALRRLDFESYAGWWQPTWRAGAGAMLPAAIDVVAGLVFDAPESAPGSVRLVAAAEVPLGAQLGLALQHEREPGLEPRTRCGLVWSPSAVHLVAGYDATTGAASAGVAWTGTRRRLAWGARSHLELGWSHACTLELRR
jgi:hypothetical protein